MANYYVNNTAQDNGDHEVHKQGCQWLDRAESVTHLGDFTSCHPAVEAAKNCYDQVDGCSTCSPDCHSS